MVGNDFYRTVLQTYDGEDSLTLRRVLRFSSDYNNQNLVSVLENSPPNNETGYGPKPTFDTKLAKSREYFNLLFTAIRRTPRIEEEGESL